MRKKSISVLAVMTFILMIAQIALAGPALQAQQIMDMQKKLTAAGYKCECTGKLDQETVESLKKFQADHGLKVDGICGKETMKALVKAAEEKSKSTQPATEQTGEQTGTTQ